MAKILHLEDHIEINWSLIQEARAFGHEVFYLGYIPESQYLQEILDEGAFDLILCDGSIQEGGDGSRLAQELFSKGYKVAMASRDRYGLEGIPDVRIGGWNWEVINSLLSQ